MPPLLPGKVLVVDDDADTRANLRDLFELDEQPVETAVLIVTGYSDLEGAIAALRQGAVDYIVKPIDPAALRASLLRVADRRRLALAKARSEAAFAALV